MGKAKQRKSKKQLDSIWKPHWKPKMNAEQYRNWAFHELGKDSIICFIDFDDTCFEIPNWVIDKAPEWIEKMETRGDFLMAIMFDELNQNFLTKKSDELSVKYKLSQRKMYFEVLKGLLIASQFVDIERQTAEEENSSGFISISNKSLQGAKKSFNRQTRPIYQKCAALGIDLTKYELILNNSFNPEDIKTALLDLTLKLRHHPQIIDEIIETIPELWILSETRKVFEKE